MIRKLAPAALAAGALALLGGCGGGGDAQIAGEGEGAQLQQRLLAMEEGQRNAVFIRALRDAGQPCQHVAASGFQQEHRGQPMWAARCSDGGEYALFIGRGGEAQVIDCDVAVRSGIPACRIDDASAAPANAVDDPEGPAEERQ